MEKENQPSLHEARGILEAGDSSGGPLETELKERVLGYTLQLEESLTGKSNRSEVTRVL